MRNRNWRGGFTLIELLVVIAIIGLLAAILFPVFARVRENARKATCQSNLRQIALGFHQYTSDYDGRFPQAWDTNPIGRYVSAYFDNLTLTPGDAPLVWPAKLEPYLKNRQIFTCPSRIKATSSNACAAPYYPTTMDMEWKDGTAVVGPGEAYTFAGASHVAYGYNVFYLGGGQFYDPYVTPGCIHKLVPTAANCYTCGVGASEASLASTASTLLLVDNYWNNRGAGAGPAFATYFVNEPGPGLWCYADGVTHQPYDRWDSRHNGGLNVAFADGHVKWMKEDELLYTPGNTFNDTCGLNWATTDPRFIWNRL